MFPANFGRAGICDVPTMRLPVDFKPIPSPHPLRHPQPAHSQTPDLPRAAMPGLNFGAMAAAGFPAIPGLSFGPLNTPTSSVAVPTPLFPYPVGVPMTPFSVAGHQSAADIRNLGLYHSAVNRPQPMNAIDSNKIKTPINRNYLELAMLVCNTFRGKLFPCPHCRYVTDRRNNLKRHISTMHQACDKLLECCGVTFSTKSSLREHIMIFHHNGYSCPYCGRRFCRKALLKRHLSVHSGQKDYTCPSCDYATSHKSNLERHKRIHERLKLGEEGSYFGCGDYSPNPEQSPDKEDTSIDIDTIDEDSIDVDSDDDIEVGDDCDISNMKYRYPIFYPNPRATAAQVSNGDNSNELEAGEIIRDAHGERNKDCNRYSEQDRETDNGRGDEDGTYVPLNLQKADFCSSAPLNLRRTESLGESNGTAYHTQRGHSETNGPLNLQKSPDDSTVHLSLQRSAEESRTALKLQRECDETSVPLNLQRERNESSVPLNLQRERKDPSVPLNLHMKYEVGY